MFFSLNMFFSQPGVSVEIERGIDGELVESTFGSKRDTG